MTVRPGGSSSAARGAQPLRDCSAVATILAYSDAFPLPKVGIQSSEPRAPGRLQNLFRHHPERIEHLTMLQQSPSRADQLLLFARNFLKHPRMLGSVIPSSRYLINQVLGKIVWSRANVIVEYGPGVGTFTAEILRNLPQNGKLLVVETNEDFVEFLRVSIPDPRLHVMHGSAADVSRYLTEIGAERADYIISGIPFSTMPVKVRDDIIRATREALQPDGAFLVYQFSPKVQPYLESEFRQVDRAFELRNILPAQLFFCLP